MKVRTIDAPESPKAGGYSQAIEVADASKLLFISGQIGMRKDGTVPPEFELQCRVAWNNIKAQLSAADMTVSNLIKVNTFLSDRKYADENAKIRTEMLEGNRPANSSMVATILDSDWLLEIEAVAAN